jgi:hypothetical protein
MIFLGGRSFSSDKPNPREARTFALVLSQHVISFSVMTRLRLAPETRIPRQPIPVYNPPVVCEEGF